ncbi:hypothetical protein [Streptomyces sp. NPDC004296]|uniref:hypothetical protein n=1 Tax=Streptomyces sp. NPDC004296 TaxID=3364697 RepID=UPI0036A445E5
MDEDGQGEGGAAGEGESREGGGPQWVAGAVGVVEVGVAVGYAGVEVGEGAEVGVPAAAAVDFGGGFAVGEAVAVVFAFVGGELGGGADGAGGAADRAAVGVAGYGVSLSL